MSHHDNRIRSIGIYKAAPNISPEEYRKRMEAMADGLLELPIYKRNILRYQMLFPDSASDSSMKSVGFHAVDVGAVVVAEYEISRDHDVLKVLAAANASGTYEIATTQIFTVESVTKVQQYFPDKY
ncbi:hypothetical protein C8J57DRAFT_1727436 [Mycena rebaudengoi]|nr:hypothetical protein C8J57DRAFT_1727436 [Mycena rebaudengoi]